MSMLAYSSPVFAVRCGTDIVKEGDLKYQIRKKCGEPISIEQTGYIDKKIKNDRIKVANTEEWIYKLRRSYYRLMFEGNTLVSLKLVDTD